MYERMVRIALAWGLVSMLLLLPAAPPGLHLPGPVALVAGSAAPASAHAADDPFQDFYTRLRGWLTGSLAKAMVLMFLVAAAGCVAASRYSMALGCLVAAGLLFSIGKIVDALGG
jgi:type IV secretory pathway VirB2 component (pilin)